MEGSLWAIQAESECENSNQKKILTRRRKRRDKKEREEGRRGEGKGGRGKKEEGEDGREDEGEEGEEERTPVSTLKHGERPHFSS